MKHTHSLRALLRTATVSGLLLFVAVGFLSAAGSAIPERKVDSLRLTERNVMEVLIDTYGATDWSSVANHVLAHADDAGNPNIFMIPISLGNGYLNRYEFTRAPADSAMALQYFEAAAADYPFWKNGWLTPAVVEYLVISVNRMHKRCDNHWDLPVAQRKRAAVLWKSVRRILKEEADFRLTLDLPWAPLDSCFTGDTKAEENAWEAALFAVATNFLPDEPHANAWDRKARQLAYDAITRPSDPPDESGIKTCTVSEDFTLSNHGLEPNPYYTGATLFLMTQGALAYKLADRPIPEEFTHNVPELAAQYRSYVDDDLSWRVPSDPEGDGTIFPLVLDSELEKAIVLKKSFQGYLWKPTAPVAVMGTGSDLWEAIQNSKVVFYYLVGSYLWHAPLKSPCSGIRYTMPVFGEVR